MGGQAPTRFLLFVARSELARVRPSHVINAAGKRGDPNVDWCESHKEETIRSNILGAVNLADCCFIHDVHLTHLGSGCIYDYNEDHAWGGPGYTEEDEPNFTGSFYSNTKVLSERVLRHYSNVLILRIRNPIGADLHPKNMITKLASYKKLINVPNTNPGSFTHNEVMDLLKKHIWPELQWENFTEEEQRKVLMAPRCNTSLDVGKLERKLSEYGYRLPTAHEAMEDAFIKIKQSGNLNV
ncbi:NRS/ER [Aspergillus luchuensis]|uniref:NRS/ER n=1 Tax=Aspergillus kawachii TaxID=1069201 RepID=A0A146F2Q5_ASPKA|nr:NRS/ER [Aspergillus luchuensis]